MGNAYIQLINNSVIQFMVNSLFFFTAIEIARSLRGHADISDVVNAIIEGLTSASPSDRYMVGRDARYGLIPLSFFPASFADFVINFVFKLPQPRCATYD